MPSGLKQAIIRYFTMNVDRVVTLDELDEEFSEHHRGSLSSTMSTLCRSDEFPAERVGNGLYRWNSNGQTGREEYEKGDMMEVMLVKKKDDDTRLLLHDEHGEVWVARQIDLGEL